MKPNFANSDLDDESDMMDMFDDNDFDGSDMFDDNDGMQGMVEGIFRAVNSQMNISFQLTKIILEKQSGKNMTEEGVLNLYDRCTKSVLKTSPISKFIEQLQKN